MQDLVARLVAEDKGFAQVIQNAKKSLQDFGKQADVLDRTRQRFNQVQNGSGSLAQNLSATKKEMQRLAQAGLQGTDTFQELAKAAAQYKEQLQEVDKAIKDAIAKQEKMNGKGSIKELFSDPQKALGDIASASGLSGLSGALGAIATPSGAAVAAIGAVSATCVEAAKKASEFETALTSLSALTGLQGDDLNSLGQSARDLAKTYGSSATEVLASMETIGSQAPELLKNKDALVAVTDAANVLAKSGGMSVDEAAKAITTTMNQMGASASEAMNIVNTLGAGSQQGAAGVQYLNIAFEKAGTQARAARMSYSDLAAAIETVAPKFSSADVAGTALNGTLLSLSQAEDKYNPQVVGLSKALENLSQAQLGNAEMSKLVGASNITMLSSLIEGREQFDEFSKSLVGTTTAQDQAALKMQTFDERVNRLKSSWEDFLISLGQSSFIQGTMDLIAELGEGLMQVVNCLMDVFDALCSIGDNQVVSTFDWLKQTFNVLVNIIEGVATAVEIIIRAIAKLQAKVKEVVEDYALKQWNELKKSINDTSWYKSVRNALDKIKKFFKDCIDWVIDKWNKMCDALGMENKKITVETDIQEIKDDISNADSYDSSSSKGSSTSSSKGKKGKKEVAPDGSLQALEDELSKAKKKLSMLGKDTTQEDILNAKNRIKEIEDAIKQRKIELGIEVASDDSLQELEKRLTEFNNKLKRLGDEASDEQIRDIRKAIKKVEKDIERKKIKLGIEPNTNKAKLTRLKRDLQNAMDEASTAGIKQALEEADEMGVTFGAELRETIVESHKKAASDVQRLYNQGLLTEAQAKAMVDPIAKEIEKYGKSDLRLRLKPFIPKEEFSEQQQQVLDTLNNLLETKDILKQKYELGFIDDEGINDKVAALNKLILKMVETFGIGELQLELIAGIQPNGELLSLGDIIKKSLTQVKNMNDELSSMSSEFGSCISQWTSFGFQIKETSDMLKLFSSYPQSVQDAISSMTNKAIPELAKTMQLCGKIGGTLAMVGNTASQVGQSLEQLGASAAVSKIGLVAGAIGQLVLGYATATAQAASMGPWAWIGFAAAGLATLTSTIASISQFENGGIVGGNSYKGDKILARVNSGEMVINKKQQASLYAQINGGASNNNSLNGTVEFKIQGSTLKGCLNNYDKKMSKIR